MINGELDQICPKCQNTNRGDRMTYCRLVVVDVDGRHHRRHLHCRCRGTAGTEIQATIGCSYSSHFNVQAMGPVSGLRFRARYQRWLSYDLLILYIASCDQGLQPRLAWALPIKGLIKEMVIWVKLNPVSDDRLQWTHPTTFSQCQSPCFTCILDLFLPLVYFNFQQ